MEKNIYGLHSAKIYELCTGNVGRPFPQPNTSVLRRS